MDQNRPLTPQEREWMREKQLSSETDSDNLDGARLSAEEVARLRQGQQQETPTADGMTIPAIPLNIPRQNQTPPVQSQPPAPNAQEMAWHREKQMPNNPGQPFSAAPEFMPTQEALPQVSRQNPPPPVPPQVRPEALPTREALPQVPRQQPQVQPKQDPMTAPALPQQPRQPQPPMPPQNQTRPGPPQPPQGQPRPQNQPPGQAPSRPYQPLGQGPNNPAGLSAQELQWQREKQAYPTNPTGMTPQELEWQREKQAYQQQTRPNSTPNMTPQERQWQQEKQAYPANPSGLSPQELEWQREKQNYGGAAAGASGSMTPQERQWQQEKQGYTGAGMAPVPALSPQERQWQQEKQGGMAPQVAANSPRNPGPPPPYVPQGVARQPERKRPIWLWILIPLILLLVAAAAVFFLVINKPGPVNTGTPTSSVASITGTPGVSASAAPTTPGVTGTAASGNGTPGATGGTTTTGVATTGVATTGTAAVPGTVTAGVSPSVATTSAQNETLFTQGKTAYDNKNYLDAITAWEKVDPKSDTYTKVKPLLGDAYYNAANDLALNNTSADSLTQAIGYYNKASGIDASNADYRTGGENAAFYQSGAKSLSTRDWDTAVNLLSQLYSRNPNFRDGPQLYYASLEGQGDTAAAAGNLALAKDSYSTALGLNFKSNPPDTTALQAKLTDVNAKLNPTPTIQPSPTTVPTVTVAPTPTKKPTPTPKPAPTATPVPPQPCAKGGSGSNFFAFRTGQPQVPNVADQGRSGVRGVVLNKSGAPLAGATVRIATNGHVFSSVTDGGGNYFREGLGRGIWTISVVAAPGRTVCYAATGTVTLSGQSGFYGSVDFTESVP